MADDVIIRWRRWEAIWILDVRHNILFVKEGYCSRCGVCCANFPGTLPSSFWDEENKKCKYLKVLGGVGEPRRKIGEPNSCYCTLHTTSFYKPFWCVYDYRESKREDLLRRRNQKEIWGLYCTYYYRTIKPTATVDDVELDFKRRPPLVADGHRRFLQNFKDYLKWRGSKADIIA
jgi:hypothetical protein